MLDAVIILILCAVLGTALSYMNRNRSKGVSCIGCPDAHSCPMKKAGQSCEGKGSRL